MFSSVKSKSNDTAEEELRTRPPYTKDPEAKEPFKQKYIGQCYCGSVEIAVNCDPLDVRVCHCRGCQRTHGASYQWSAFFHKHQVLFTRGHEFLEFYNTQTRLPHHKLPVKILCKDCHAPLADEGRRMMLIFPPVFEWENGKMPDSFKPRCHMFYGARTFDIEDGAPKFEGMKERSDTLPECEGDSDCDDNENGDKRDEASDEMHQPTSPPSKGAGHSHKRAADAAGNGAVRPENGNSIAAHVKRLHTADQ